MVKVFQKWVKLQGQGQSVKNTGTNGKVISQKYETLAHTFSKVISKVFDDLGGTKKNQNI